MATCRIDLLGGMRVTSASGVITRFRTQKTAALLGYLAFHSPRTHPRDHLVELLWPDGDPELGRRSLRTALSSLRHQLEPPGVEPGSVLIAGRHAVGLNPEGVVTDVGLFLGALRRAAAAATPHERALGWSSAIELYGGPLLAGQWEDWVVAERQHVAVRFFEAAAGLVSYHEQMGDHSSALDVACAALREDPLREEAHADVIRVYVASGQLQAALEHYRQWERTLRREMDLAPSDAVRALVSGIEPSGQRRAALGREPISPTGGPSRPARPPQRPARASVNADILSLPSRRDAPGSMAGDTVTLVMADLPGRPEDAPAAECGGVPAGGTDPVAALAARYGGQVLRGGSDDLAVAFASAADALGFAIALQSSGAQATSGAGHAPVPPGVALHTGDVVRAFPADDADQPGWVGLRDALQTVGRILRAMRPGHVVCSEETAAILRRRLEPGVRLLDLGSHHLLGSSAVERLFEVRHASLPDVPEPPLAAETASAGNLPAQVTRFFGREQEAADLRRLLLEPDVRLVTLTGLGGSGKTRLALEVARQLLEDLRGAVWFVSLVHLSDARSIPDAVLDALGLLRSPGREPMAQVVAALTGAPALLILDNLEQIADEGGRVVADLLARTGTLSCLVTSRRALGMPGERLFPVMPLPVPGGDEPPEALAANPSVRLFVDRAQAVRPDFQITQGNARTLAALCARLDGIPLALELVAVRAGVLSPAQMLARLDECLHWEPAHGRAADGRHRSIRAAMDWSYRLLPPETQRFFECLSVFRGGWSLDAAQCIGAGGCEGSPLVCLSRLGEHSLVLSEERGGEIRFRMLEAIRDYAWDRLVERGEAESVCRRHAEYFLALAEEMGPKLHGPQRQECLECLDLEHDNLRAALSWCAGSAPEMEGHLAGALGQFWEVRGHSGEGRRWLEAVLAQGTGLSEPVRNKVLHGAARLAWYQGDFGRAGVLLQELLAGQRLAGDEEELAAVLLASGDVSHRQCRLEDACRLFREALGIFRRVRDVGGVAACLYRLGMALCDSGRQAEAAEVLEEGLASARAAGDRATISAVKSMMGHAYFRLGRLDEARAAVRDALAVARELDDVWAIVFAQWSLGNMALMEGDLATAESLFRDGMPRLVALGNKWAVAYGLEAFGCLAAATGHVGRAARLLGAADALRAAIGAPLPPVHRPSLNGVVAGVRTAMGAAFERAWAEGRAMAWDEAAHDALADLSPSPWSHNGTSGR